MPPLSTLLAELRRRRVFRVAAGYCAAALLLIEAANNIFPALALPGWTTRLVVILLILGLPVALVLAWAFDVTPEGITRTPEATPEHAVAPPPLRGRARTAYVGVALLVVLAGAAAYARFHGRLARAAPAANAPAEEPRSVAVLPFVNMSGQKENEYFSDGITEEILDALAHVPALRVAARTSSFAFKGKSEDVAAIARQLRVTHVLEGSVQREGGSVRITAQLIDARTGYHVWSEKYTREVRGIFALEDEISKAIAGQLQARLAPGAVLARTGTRSPEAHELYLRGRQLFARNSSSSEKGERRFLAAIDLYRTALEVDSSYAAPWVGIADCYGVLADRFWAPARAYPLAREAALRALALDSTLADAHAMLGMVLFENDWDFAGAEREARTALRLRPSSAPGHLLLNFLAMSRGDWSTAVREAENAASLDPATPRYRAYADYARLRTAEGPRIRDSLWTLVHERPADEQLLRRAIGASGVTGDLARERTGMQLLHTRFAMDWAKPANPLMPMNLARVGDTATARRALAFILERARSRYVPASVIAADYAALGERARALDWIERAYRERDSYLVFYARENYWDPLRTEPRYQVVRAKVGLP